MDLHREARSLQPRRKEEQGRTGNPSPIEWLPLDTWWKLLEEEFKPKGNRIISIIDWYSPKSKQGSRNLNEWLTNVYNLADACNFKESRDRMIRDILIVGCNSTSARDKIVRKGENITLNEVIELLQVENSTHQTLQEMNSTTQKVHYASYDKKKSKGKKKGTSDPYPTNSTSSTSTAQKPISTGKLCFRCKAPFSQEHIATCKAQNAVCDCMWSERPLQKGMQASR